MRSLPAVEMTERGAGMTKREDGMTNREVVEVTKRGGHRRSCLYR